MRKEAGTALIEQNLESAAAARREDQIASRDLH
jgi:hypothetical protein